MATLSSMSGGVLIDSRLVGVSAVEQALRGDAGEQPGQFRDFGDIGLPVKRDALGVQPGGQPTRGNFHGGALDARRVIDLDQGVVVGQKIEALHIAAQAGLH